MPECQIVFFFLYFCACVFFLCCASLVTPAVRCMKARLFRCGGTDGGVAEVRNYSLHVGGGGGGPSWPTGWLVCGHLVGKLWPRPILSLMSRYINEVQIRGACKLIPLAANDNDTHSALGYLIYSVIHTRQSVRMCIVKCIVLVESATIPLLISYLALALHYSTKSHKLEQSKG